MIQYFNLRAPSSKKGSETTRRNGARSPCASRKENNNELAVRHLPAPLRFRPLAQVHSPHPHASRPTPFLLRPPLGDHPIGLTRLEEEDGNLTKVKVNKVLGLVGHVGPKVAPDHAVPGRQVLLVELLLDVGGNVLLNVVLVERRGGDLGAGIWGEKSERE